MARKRIEYLREAIKPQDLQNRLSALGSEGWDLAAAVPTHIHADCHPWLCVFKRDVE